VDREARMDPPIQAEYFLSEGAMMFMFVPLGARAVMPLSILEAIPVNTQYLQKVVSDWNDCGFLFNFVSCPSEVTARAMKGVNWDSGLHLFEKKIFPILIILEMRIIDSAYEIRIIGF
jgi:hypothetical protein